MKKRKTILVDLDGVLNDYTGNYDKNYIPPLRRHALNFLALLNEKYDIKIFTTRPRELAQKWVDDNGLSEMISGVTNEKIPAYLIIDDRCLRFCGDYEKTFLDVESFKPWYRN